MSREEQSEIRSAACIFAKSKTDIGSLSMKHEKDSVRLGMGRG